jgi:phosphoglycolate phosphatase-like HAD superfamily hydrolase
MNKNRKIVVFDFDGVVCDSTDECMVTSWNAWEKWNERDAFRTNLREFNEKDRLSFRKVRPRVRGAGEYYILRRALSEGLRIDNQEEYDQLEEKWKDKIEPFKVVFFKAREKLREIDLEGWIGLHPVFDGVIESMKTLNRQSRLYIATLKDAESVKLILGKQGLKIADENLLDQSKIKTKLQALDIFRKRIGCDKVDMIFIDDNVTHLLEPNNAGYSVFLTTWGYTMNEYLHIAKTENIPIMDKYNKLENY